MSSTLPSDLASWIFEGEDCNRHFYWTVAPFYDRAFLRAALACTDDQKSGHRLYRKFLRHLHPAVNRIPGANLGIAMDSPRYAWSRRLREVGRGFRRLRRLLGKGMPASVLQPRPALMGAFLTRQIERSEPVRSCFSTRALAGVAASPGAWSDAALDGLVTATCANCHTAHRELPPDNPQSTVHASNVADTCGNCHHGIEETFSTSIHWPGNVETDRELPTCEDCHSSHSISRTGGADARLEMMDQCGRCHEKEAETFFDTFHGKVSRLGTSGPSSRRSRAQMLRTVR